MLTDPSSSQQEVSNIQCSRCIGCKHYHIFRHFIHTLVRTLSLLYLGFRCPWLTKMALNCNLNLVCLRRTSSVRPLSRSTPAWSVNNSNRSSRWSSSSNSCKSNSRALRSDKWMLWGNESVPCQYVSPISVWQKYECQDRTCNFTRSFYTCLRWSSWLKNPNMETF